ncbi:Golgi-associated plant pathogenesis-related protein 1 [Orchesella cincta]|uniref:Golgi-associated plant pathogenesis-related protein 1 n=1 Tax=Orchesella cincta TaxID=48709 RepID=A0A1D2M2V6_ORCCI|nr:Golgi-associated plant pathogenesis-related protein 1 [Orchesella cincta]
MKQKDIIVLFLVALHLVENNAEQVILYEDSNFKGDYITLTLSGNECVTLPEYWYDRASSINTQNNCVIAWSYSSCVSGSSERIAPGTPLHSQLSGIELDDQIRSVQLCSGPAQETGGRWAGVRSHYYHRISHSASELDGGNEELHQAARRHAEYLAENNILVASSTSQNVGEAEGNREEEAVRKVIRSWYREERHYDYKQPGFREETRHYSALVWKSTTEVGIGVAWNPIKKVYVVVANYNPVGNRNGEFNQNVVPQQRFAEFPVVFYEHHNFEGESIKMELIGGCHNFPEGWHDRATSVNADYKCIVAWEHYGCVGKSVRIKNQKISNLGDLGFNDVMSSFNLCSTLSENN